MALFVLNSLITITNPTPAFGASGVLQFSGVHEVAIKKSIHNFIDYAKLTLPYKCLYNGNVVALAKCIADGWLINIKLGYNGQLVEEFSGFIKKRGMNIPLEIECEGYSYIFSRTKFKGGYWPSISVKDILIKLLNGTGVTLNCTIDVTLSSFQIPPGSVIDAINAVLKSMDNCCTAFFIQPTTLWVGLPYTAYSIGNSPSMFTDNNGNSTAAPVVNLKLGYNTIWKNTLKIKTLEDEPKVFIYCSSQPDGNIIKGVSPKYSTPAAIKKKFLNTVGSQSALTQLAAEKQIVMNYKGYEGYVEAFLQPYALPGYSAYIVNPLYPDRNATYVIEGTEVTFGVGGARRKIEIGPQIGFGSPVQADNGIN